MIVPTIVVVRGGGMDEQAGMADAVHELAALSEEAADEVWSANPNALVATGHHGAGEFTGARRLTGRWESVVGAEHAQWLLLSAGTLRVLLPRSGVRVDPVHDHADLRGAGCGDVTVDGWPVDEQHVLDARHDRVAVCAGAAAAAAAGGRFDSSMRWVAEVVTRAQ